MIIALGVRCFAKGNWGVMAVGSGFSESFRGGSSLASPGPQARGNPTTSGNGDHRSVTAAWVLGGVSYSSPKRY